MNTNFGIYIKNRNLYLSLNSIKGGGLDNILPHLNQLKHVEKNILAQELEAIFKKYNKYVEYNGKTLKSKHTKSKFIWNDLKKANIPQDAFFELSCKKDKSGFRCEFVNTIIKFLIDNYCAECEVRPTGSVGSTPGSDYDLTLIGPESVIVLKLFDSIVKNMFGNNSSSVVFDTNLYTVGFIMIINPEIKSHVVYNSVHFNKIQYSKKNFIYIEPTDYVWKNQLDWAKMKLMYWLRHNKFAEKFIDDKLNAKLDELLGDTTTAPNIFKYIESMEEFHNFDTPAYQKQFAEKLVVDENSSTTTIKKTIDSITDLLDTEFKDEQIASMTKKLNTTKQICIQEYDSILKNRLANKISKVSFYGDETYWSLGTFYHIVGFAYTFGNLIQRTDNSKSDTFKLPSYYIDKDTCPINVGITKFMKIQCPELFACSMIENLGDIIKELTHKSEYKYKWINLSKYLMRYFDAVACFYSLKQDRDKSYKSEQLYMIFKEVKNTIRGFESEYSKRNKKFEQKNAKDLDNFLKDELGYDDDSQFVNSMIHNTFEAIGFNAQ